MNILSITVGGFKNITKVNLSFENIVFLLAPNNVGKSNLLEAIRFGFDFINTHPKRRDKLLSSYKYIPLAPASAGLNYFFEIEFEDDTLDDDYRFIKYGFEVSWYKNKEKKGNIENEWMEARPQPSRKYTTYLKHDTNEFRTSKSTASFKKLNINEEGLVLAIDLLSILQSEMDISSIVKSVKNIRFNLCKDIDLKKCFQHISIEFAGQSMFDIFNDDEPDIPKLLYGLKSQDPEHYALFVEALYDLFPEFNDVSVEYIKLNQEVSGKVAGEDEDEKESHFKMSEGLYNMQISSRYLNQPVNVEMMSAGTKRIIWLLALTLTSSYKNMTFLAIEELETSIHPKLMKKLMEIINEYSDNVKLIITSHSPVLVQYFKTDGLYIGLVDDDGGVTFKKIRKQKVGSLYRAAKSHGMTLGDYLFDRLGRYDSSSFFKNYLEGYGELSDE